MPHMSVSEMQKRNMFLETENKRLMNENAHYKKVMNQMIMYHSHDVKTISDLKTDLEDAYDDYNGYKVNYTNIVAERDAEIERLKNLCASIKNGKNAQIVALDKEVDDLKAELIEEKAYTEKSLHYANNNEQQLITEIYELKRRLDAMTLNEKYPTNADAGAYAYALADAKKSLAEKTEQLDVVNQKLINVQKAVLLASTYMTEAITTN